MQREVAAVERAYVAAATTGSLPTATSSTSVIAAAATGAVASRFLAVASPRSIGLVGGAEANAASLAAHRVWFKPVDIRCHGDVVVGGRSVDLDDALGADIVCIHVPLAIAATQLRRGTHVNALAAVELPDIVATIVHDRADLPAIVAGLRDGRKLDEITVFVLGDGAIAMAALVIA